MLHILILILKIIGIIIAVILGILLLLIAIFLFVPVHYEIQGRCDGDLDSLKGKVQVTWLLQLVRADILYKNGKMKWRLRFAWIKRGNTGAGKKQKEAQTQQKQAEKAEKAEISGIEEAKKAEISGIEEERSNHEKSITETDKIEKNEPEKFTERSEEDLAAPQTIRQKSAHAPEPEKWKTKNEISEKEKSVDSEKNGSFYQRILSWIQKIKCTFGKLCDKIKALSGKKEKLEEFLRDEVHKGAYHKCKKELFRLMKHLKPKKADVRIVYGFDDPYHTGQALAVFGVLYPFVGGCISVTPDFEHQVLKGSAYLKGKIYLWHFVQSGWKLIWNRNVRQTYRDIRNFKIK